MNIRISKGTVKGGIHLCDSCVHYRIRRHENGDSERQCTVGDEKTSWALIRGSSVSECSVYHNSGNMDLNAMSSIAWDYMKDMNGNVTFINQNITRQFAVTAPRLTRWQKFRMWIKWMRTR